MEELWKDVVEYPTLFLVSNTGRVFGKRSNKILKTSYNKQGYETFASKIGGRKGINICLRVHRLVAEAFLPLPSKYLEDLAALTFYKIVLVNHKDGNKGNNTVGNLEWCSYSYNRIHALETKLSVPTKGGDSPASIFKNDEERFKSYLEFLASKKSMREFSRLNNYSHGVISRMKHDFS